MSDLQAPLSTDKQALWPAEEVLYHLQVATREAEVLVRGGIIEVAVRNRSVAEYMRHWEGRTEKAENELQRLQVEHERYKQCLYRANGRLIQLGQEPEKLSYESTGGPIRSTVPTP